MGYAPALILCYQLNHRKLIIFIIVTILFSKRKIWKYSNYYAIIINDLDFNKYFYLQEI